MRRFFKKEMFQNPVWLKSGKQLAFAFTVDNTGVVEVDDEKEPEFAAELKKVCGKFGISEITPEQFEDLKKKTPSPQRPERSNQLRIFAPNSDPFASKRQHLPAAVASLSEIPTAPVTPPSAKPVAAPASASSVVDSSLAAPAGAPAEPAFKPRTGNVRNKKRS